MQISELIINVHNLKVEATTDLHGAKEVVVVKDDADAHKAVVGVVIADDDQ